MKRDDKGQYEGEGRGGWGLIIIVGIAPWLFLGFSALFSSEMLFLPGGGSMEFKLRPM